MIVYSADCDTRLSDYGILIPLKYNKAEKVYKMLCDGCMKNIPTESWLYTPKTVPATKETLLLCHTKRFVESLFSDSLENELFRIYELINADGSYNRYDPTIAKKPFQNLLNEILTGVQVGIEASEIALKTGFAYFLGGGAHHAMADYGAGFCIVNDVVIIAKYLQHKKLAKNIWIIDVDAHKGDGTAFLTHGDNTIKTLSIHMKDGWPLNEPQYDENGNFNPSWTDSDIDIGIASGEELEYVPRLQSALLKMKTQYEKPDIAIIVGGVDPYEKDELLSTNLLKLTSKTLLERDMLVYGFFKAEKIPQLHLMAGGYGAHSWEIYVNFLEKVLKAKN